VMQDAHALDDVEPRGEVRPRNDLANIALAEFDAGGAKVFRHACRIREARHREVDRGDTGVRAVGVRLGDDLPPGTAAGDQHLERTIHELEPLGREVLLEHLAPFAGPQHVAEARPTRIGVARILSSDLHRRRIGYRPELRDFRCASGFVVFLADELAYGVADNMRPDAREAVLGDVVA
jgi:hypothetical protein